MSLDLISSDAVKVLLSSNKPPLNELLSFGLDYFARCCEKRADIPKRFNAFKVHAPFFSQCETTLDVLELIWTSASAGPYASDYLAVLRQVIDELPAYCRDTPPAEEPSGLLRTVAVPIIVFVTKHRLTQMMQPLSAKAFGSSGWMFNSMLRDHLLLAATAMDDLSVTNEMLGRFVEQERLVMQLNYKSFLMLCCAYMAGIPFRRSKKSIEQALSRLEKIQTIYDNNFTEAFSRPVAFSLSRSLIDEKMDEVRSVLVGIRTSGDSEEALSDAVINLISSLNISQNTFANMDQAFERIMQTPSSQGGIPNATLQP